MTDVIRASCVDLGDRTGGDERPVAATSYDYDPPEPPRPNADENMKFIATVLTVPTHRLGSPEGTPRADAVDPVTSMVATLPRQEG
jgi:hypothetical protein